MGESDVAKKKRETGKAEEGAQASGEIKEDAKGACADIGQFRRCG